MGTDPDTEKYIGLREDEACVLAMNNWLTARIIRRDGNSFVVTRDYRTDRVNFTVETRHVTKAFIG